MAAVLDMVDIVHQPGRRRPGIDERAASSPTRVGFIPCHAKSLLSGGSGLPGIVACTHSRLVTLPWLLAAYIGANRAGPVGLQ